MARVYPDWTKRLWSRLEELAQQSGQPLELRMGWPDAADVWFDVRLSNGKPRAVVDDRVIALLDQIDQNELIGRLLHADQRTQWLANASAIRAARGNTISLAAAARNICSPLAGRVTLNVDFHQSLKVDKDSLRPLLPADLMAKVDAETRLLTPRRLGELLGIPVFKQEPDAAKESAASSGAFVAAEEVDDAPDEDDDEDEVEVDGVDDGSPLWRSHNLIFFGPPGTGKSHQLDELVRNHLVVKADGRILRVTFHPEYSYFDFVGNYRPAVGWLTTSGARFLPETPGAAARTEEPRVYYLFEPGPLSLAIAAAARVPDDENVVLIIEEINRGNCAAIFGDVFQLLDRKSDLLRPNEYGLSQYPIAPTGAWATWLDANLPRDSPAWRGGQLRLPRNLFLYATMNTSDQNLFPMDAAFRRRWSMQYVSVDAGDPPTEVPVQYDRYQRWSQLLRPINRAIVAHTRSDDKQLGPWFVRPRRDNRVDPEEFASKVLFYLWSEVFRDAPEKLFRAEIETYDQLVRTYLEDKRPVFEPRVVPDLASGPRDEAAPLRAAGGAGAG